MYKKKINILFIGLCGIFMTGFLSSMGCSSYKGARDFSGFPVEKKLTALKVVKTKGIVGMLLYHDSILICRHNVDDFKNQLRLINLNHPNDFIDCLPTSRKEGEGVIGFMSYGLYKNYFWSEDITKNEFVTMDLDKILMGETDPKKYLNVYPLNFDYYWSAMIGDHSVVSYGNYDSEYKLAFYDLMQKKYTDYKLPYNKSDMDSMTRSQKQSYEGPLFVRPDFSKYVIASGYTDQIEIYDPKRDSSKIIRGPVGFKPTFTIMTDGDGKDVAGHNNQTRNAFIRGATTDKYIYLLYSGRTETVSYSFYGKFIYVYDWQGTPVAKFELSDYMSGIGVTSDNMILYAYNFETNYIEKYSLDLNAK